VFTDLLNPEMQFLKSHLYQLSNANFPLHFSTLACELQNLLTVCRKRQQIWPNRAWTASLCSIYCCLVLFSFYYFLFFTIYFLEVETASEMTKTMLEWVFHLLTLVNIAFVN